jgi:hypothetical protein
MFCVCGVSRFTSSDRLPGRSIAGTVDDANFVWAATAAVTAEYPSNQPAAEPSSRVADRPLVNENFIMSPPIRIDEDC